MNFESDHKPALKKILKEIKSLSQLAQHGRSQNRNLTASLSLGAQKSTSANRHKCFHQYKKESFRFRKGPNWQIIPIRRVQCLRRSVRLCGSPTSSLAKFFWPAGEIQLSDVLFQTHFVQLRIISQGSISHLQL